MIAQYTSPYSLVHNLCGGLPSFTVHYPQRSILGIHVQRIDFLGTSTETRDNQGSTLRAECDLLSCRVIK